MTQVGRVPSTRRMDEGRSTEPVERAKARILSTVHLEQVDDHRWRAGTAAIAAEGFGATPAEALSNLANVEGFDDAVIAWQDHLRERDAADKAIYQQIYEEKRLHKQRKRAERSAPNVISLTSIRRRRR